jgi:hypothetical protein
MDTDILIALVIWLIIGVVIGGWISIDTFRRKIKGAKWVAMGVILSVIGLAIYLVMRNRIKTGRPADQHAPPEYRYSEPVTPESHPTPMEGTVIAPPPVAPQQTPEPVQPSQEPAAPKSNAPQDEESGPNYGTWAPHIKEQIEGIPRCPKCGAAVSASDEFCSECGNRLK